MNNDQILTSAFSLDRQLDKVVDVIIFELELFNAGIANATSEVCYLDHIRQTRVSCDVPLLSLEKSYAVLQRKRPGFV